MTTLDQSDPDRPLSDRPLLDELSTEEFLLIVGQRVRHQRAVRNMSRKRLAEISCVSERYLAQLESGQGNMSIALLRKVTTAIGMSMSVLMSAEITDSSLQKIRLFKALATGSQHEETLTSPLHPQSRAGQEAAVRSAQARDERPGTVSSRDPSSMEYS